MGKKSGQHTPDHKQNLNDLRNSLYTRSVFAQIAGVSLSGLRELEEVEALQCSGLPAMLYTITFNNGAVVNLTDYSIDINYKGTQFRSSNQILEIPNVRNEGKIRTEGVTVKMSGLDPTILQLIQNGEARNARLNYRVVFMTKDGKVNSGASFDVYNGYISVAKYTLELKEKDSTITLDIETKNAMMKLQRIPGNRHANAIQQERFPGDKVLSLVNSFDIEEWKIKNK